MNRKILTAVLFTGLLAACEGGDVNLTPTNIDNSVDNSTSTGGGGSNNPCASYVDGGGTTVEGNFDGTNCVYGSSFVGANNPLLQDLTIPLISGVHVFQDSLFVGVDVDSGVAPACGPDPAVDDCDGPTLTIEGGNTLAFSDSADYVRVNRGSRIIASGSPSAPITMTSFTDAVTGTAGAEDVQLWGGVILNGNGITNNCTDAERAANACHVLSEGLPSNYGGSDNTESSGILRYVIVKHTGFEVAPDDEINGITFNAIGSGTVVSHIQAYSTFDDGIEFFGGAVNVDHYVGLYVRDDSIDYSDGWSGTLDFALVIHGQTTGNRCVEGDNIGESRANGGEPLDTAPLTNPVIKNMTCILSNQDGGSRDPSEGVTIRRGAQGQYVNNLIYGGFAADAGADNECFEIDDGVTRQFAQDGVTTINQSVIACAQATKDDLNNGDPISQWVLNSSGSGADYSFNAGNTIILDAQNANVSLMDSYFTATTLTDDAGNPVTVAPAGASHIGAVLRSSDWTAPWAYGLRAGNQGIELWLGNP